MRALLLLTLGLVLWTGALPMKLSVVALAALWLPSVALNMTAGSGLARGFMHNGRGRTARLPADRPVRDAFGACKES